MMQSSENYALTGQIEVDQTYIGGYDEGEKGRSLEEKTPVVIALEIRGTQLGRAYALQIENCSAPELGKIFDKHLDNQALIKTDKWRGYLPLKEAYPNLTQEKIRCETKFSANASAHFQFEIMVAGNTSMV